MRRRKTVVAVVHTESQLVLVVDDEPAIRRVLRATLERADYRVLEALPTSVRQAIAAFLPKPFSPGQIIETVCAAIDRRATVEASRPGVSG